jgi:hypothetical protein
MIHNLLLMFAAGPSITATNRCHGFPPEPPLLMCPCQSGCSVRIAVVALCETGTILDRSNSGVVSSNPAREICLLFPVSPDSYLGYR